MNRDPWAELAAAFPELADPFPLLTTEDLDRMAEEYQRDAIAAAQSEAQWPDEPEEL